MKQFFKIIYYISHKHLSFHTGLIQGFSIKVTLNDNLNLHY